MWKSVVILTVRRNRCVGSVEPFTTISVSVCIELEPQWCASGVNSACWVLTTIVANSRTVTWRAVTNLQVIIPTCPQVKCVKLQFHSVTTRYWNDPCATPPIAWIGGRIIWTCEAAWVHPTPGRWTTWKQKQIRTFKSWYILVSSELCIAIQGTSHLL